MGQAKLTGSLIAGPASAGEGFPSSTMQMVVSTFTNPKTFGVASGILQRRVSSPAAFVALQGVGSTDTVTKGELLILKCDGGLDLRISHDNGAGGTTVVVVPVQGLVVLEFQPAKYLKLLEAQGSAQVEYFVCGPS